MQIFRVLSLLGGVVLLLAGFGWAAPKLDVDQSEYDFETVTQGEAVEHKFIFSNIGDELLVVDKVRSSCGCTAALITSKNLRPGESGELKIRFDSARFRGDVAKLVYLYTNDPFAPVARLVVKGHVQELFALAPRQLQFGRVMPGQKVEASVVLTNHTGTDLVISPPEVTTPELRTEMEAQLPAGESRPIKVILQPKPGQTRFSGYVILKTEGEKPHEIRLPVYATIGQ